MKQILIYVMAVMTVMSCSSDNGEVKVKEDSIVGTWVLSEIIVAETAAGDIQAAKLIADILLNKNCELLSFVFNTDETLLTTSKVNHIVINSLNPDCPEQEDVEEVMWQLEGNELTTTDDAGQKEVITIRLDGNMLTVNGGDIDPIYAGAVINFTRQ